MRNGALNIPYEPEIQEVITVNGENFTIVDIVRFSGNGYVLQMRKYG